MRRRHGCCTSPKEVRSFCLRVLRTSKAGKRLNTSSPRFGVTATRSKIAWDGKATAVGSEGAREYSGIEICWRQRNLGLATFILVGELRRISMKGITIRCLSVLLFVFGLSCACFGQNVTGTIAGTISDSKGGIVPNGKVSVTNSDQQVVVRTLTSDDHGLYVAALLPVGRYSVAVEAAGFKKAVRTGIVLNVDDNVAVNFTLELGSVNETISVEADLLSVDTQSATATGVISGTQLKELSLNSRNYAQLVLLVPGASDSGNADQIFPGATAPIGTNTMTFQINGGRREENNWQVDGADNVDRGSNLTLLSFPSIDAISEFRVVRGAYDAESGRSAGAQVNVITSSFAITFSTPTAFSTTPPIPLPSAPHCAITTSEALSAVLFGFPKSTSSATRLSSSSPTKRAASSPTPIPRPPFPIPV